MGALIQLVLAGSCSLLAVGYFLDQSLTERWNSVLRDHLFNTPNNVKHRHQRGVFLFLMAFFLFYTTNYAVFAGMRSLFVQDLYIDQESISGNINGTPLRDVPGRTFLTQGFTPGTSSAIKKISISLASQGVVSGYCWVEVWNARNGMPSSIVGTASSKMDIGPLIGKFINYSFDFRNAVPVKKDDLYFIVLRGDYPIDGAHYILWQFDADGRSYGKGPMLAGDAIPTWKPDVGSPSKHVFNTQYSQWHLLHTLKSKFSASPKIS